MKVTKEQTISNALFIAGALFFVAGGFLVIISQPALTGAVVGIEVFYSGMTTMIGFVLIVAALAMVIAGEMVFPEPVRTNSFQQRLGPNWQDFTHDFTHFQKGFRTPEELFKKPSKEQQFRIKKLTTNSAAACLETVLATVGVEQSQGYLAQLIGQYENAKDILFVAHKMGLRARKRTIHSLKDLRHLKNQFIMINLAKAHQANQYHLVQRVTKEHIYLVDNMRQEVTRHDFFELSNKQIIILSE